jgi:hypothetical protein
MHTHYTDQLGKVLSIRNDIQDLHPYLEMVFPIAIVEGSNISIFDTEKSSQPYSFVKKIASPMPLPVGVRAAFPLEDYDNRMACVVTNEIFDSLEGYVTIFHEFIHCHQYTAPQFVTLFDNLLLNLGNDRLGEVYEIRKRLKELLVKEDYEYMIWQEWKEGFARYIENQINRRLGLQENHRGRERPYTRVSFYEGGADFIKVLGKQDHQLTIDIEKLFYSMMV